MIPTRLLPLGRGGKPLPTAKDYVQDGLVALWDGIENAGWGVHDPNATTWCDPVSGWDAAFPSIPEREIGDTYVYYGDTALKNVAARHRLTEDEVQILAEGYTSECVFSLKPGATMQDVKSNMGLYPGLFSRYSGPDGLVWDLSSDGNYRFGMNQGLSAVVLNNASPEIRHIDSGGPLTWTRVRTTTKMVYALQGTVRREGEGVAKPVGDLRNSDRYDTLLIGAGGGQIGYNTSVGLVRHLCIRLYSRALTADEIAANYAIDKKRFSLP